MDFLGIGNVVGKFFGGIGDGVAKVTKVFSGSEAERDQQTHSQTTNAQNQLAAEFLQPKVSKWGQFIAGLNSLPRPAFVIHILAFFWLAYLDPTEFKVLCISLKAVPPLVWEYLRIILCFYFGGRIIQKAFEAKGINNAQFQMMLEQIAELRAEKKEREAQEQEDEFTAQDAKDKMEHDSEVEEMLNRFKKGEELSE